MSAEAPLLDWVLHKYPDTPKKRAKEWIQAGRVSVNGVTIRQPHHRLFDPGAALAVSGRQAVTLDCGRDGWAIHPRVTLLYLDTALAVVNKGSGLLAVSATPEDLSAQSILKDWLAGKFRGRQAPPTYRQLQPLPVHRLDLYTTGVFCLALNPAARAALIEQLQSRVMQREYVAYADGRAKTPAGTWRDWLKLDTDGLSQTVVPAETPEAEEAITHYETIAEFPLLRGFVTKLRLRLETGRKHQIRVQAAAAGLPLIGDRTYHPHYAGEFPRQALHAETLRLEHPERPGIQLAWTAPLPDDLRQLQAALQSNRPV
jgi:23S rRNA pseudouridine1911/1915/1917 synthase